MVASAVVMYAVWPGVPIVAAAPVYPAHQSIPSARPSLEDANTQSLVVQPRERVPAGEPFVDRQYACKNGQCNTCPVRLSELVGSDRVLGDGSSAQARANNTFMTRAELGAMGVKYLQVGGDWWNKCGDGWINGDMIFTRLPVNFVCEDWRTGRHIVRLDAGRPFPFADGALDAVYTEHMFEHILPMAGSVFLKEAYRVLRPGGVIRLTTPDLEKYLDGYVNRRTNTFLKDHAARWPPMGKLGKPYTAATVVNNIFRNYEHQWVYDFEEIVRTAQHAGIPADAVHRSSRLGSDLPSDFLAAIRTAEKPSTAARQAGRRENPTRCWLEQDIREQESLYVLIQKPLP